jgi:glycosyltransferase involved in cell wall biosynthesis
LPRVTVITATYNYAPVLPCSIGSVLDQTFTDFELLVIGDACTDESGDVVGAIGDPRVSWHNLTENAGHQTGPNNEGLRRARGDAIAYLGHDDLWLPRHLELLLEAMDAGAVLAHGTTLWVERDRRPILLPPDGYGYKPLASIAPTTVMHDRTVALDLGGWRMPRDTGALDPEVDLWQRISAARGRLHWVRHLTSVKLTAGGRRNLYQLRPTYEQEYWLRRIREADDPERELLAATGEDYAFATRRNRSWSHTAELVLAMRRRLRLGDKLRRAHLLRPKRAQSAEERRARSRRYKGLDG